MPSQLAVDAGYRVPGKARTVFGVEPVERLDQRQQADLEEILEWLTTIGEPGGTALGDPPVFGDELVAQPGRPRRFQFDEAPEVRGRSLVGA